MSNFMLIHSIVSEQLQFAFMPVVVHACKFTIEKKIEQRAAIKCRFLKLERMLPNRSKCYDKLMMNLTMFCTQDV